MKANGGVNDLTGNMRGSQHQKGKRSPSTYTETIIHEPRMSAIESVWDNPAKVSFSRTGGATVGLSLSGRKSVGRMISCQNPTRPT